MATGSFVELMNRPARRIKTTREAAPATDQATEVTAGAIYGEIRDFVRTHERRRRQLPRAALVGLIAGLVAVAFRTALGIGDTLRDHLIRTAHGMGLAGLVIPILFSAIGSGISVFLVRRFAPEAAGSGIPHLKAVLHRLRGMLWQRILAVKFLGGVAGIGAGMALGREGPTVQMGGAIGQMVSRWLGTTARERRTLIAAGAGAGIAAAFNAPLAGVVFVLEEVQRDFSPGVFTAAFIASATADVVARLLTNQLPVFHVAVLPSPPLSALPAFLILGVLAGILAVAFNRALLGSLNLFQRIRHLPPWVPGALAGCVVGLVGWFAPEALGGGHAIVEEVLSGRMVLQNLVIFFLIRFGLTMVSYGSGAPGGIFAPLLVLGAQIGLAVGEITRSFAPHSAEHPEAYAMVGMAAYFTGIVRAPLTGIVLIVEMTGNYALMLPLLVSCLTAHAVADALGDRPVYEALLERDLLRSQETPELEETLLVDLTVQQGAPFEGRQVKDLGLPPGCVLVTLRRGLHDEVPTANTRLQAGDQITAVVSPAAARGVIHLREGLEPAHHSS
jgi:CIC family chloride channel protein